jgi:hypothetical protein
VLAMLLKLFGSSNRHLAAETDSYMYVKIELKETIKGKCYALVTGSHSYKKSYLTTYYLRHKQLLLDKYSITQGYVDQLGPTNNTIISY